MSVELCSPEICSNMSLSQWAVLELNHQDGLITERSGLELISHPGAHNVPIT